MLIISKKHNGICVIDCWYAEHAIKQKGIIRYQEALRPIGKQPVEFRTLLSDLTEDQETILSHFSQNCKYKVRRAQREGVKCIFKRGREIEKEDIAEYVEFFEEFWCSKGVRYTEKEKDLELLTQYAAADAITMSIACVGEKKIVYHIHILEEARARLYQSASQFRVDETISSNVVGFANRYLHYQDMLWFKELGKKQYDWGGAGTGEDVESITKFKESFGGEPVIYYNGEEASGVMPRIYKGLTGIVGKFMK